MTSVNFVQEYCFYHVTTEVTTASRLLLLRLNKTREEHSEHPVKHMPLRHMSLGKGVYAVPIGITASGVAHTVDGGEESTCHSCCLWKPVISPAPDVQLYHRRPRMDGAVPEPDWESSQLRGVL